MFNRDLFVYDPLTHTATYDGEPVPSVTQLVDVLYPLDSNIPSERIKNAAEHGTQVHDGCFTLNTCFDNSYPYEVNLKQAITLALEQNKSVEVVDYISLISAFKLKPFDFEELVFLLDEEGDLICYGHYDLTAIATQEINPFRQDRLYLFDIKTTSLFNKQKVALQESIYSVAYEQCSKNQIEGVFGIWLENGAKLIPLDKMNKENVITLCKHLRREWHGRTN